MHFVALMKVICWPLSNKYPWGPLSENAVARSRWKGSNKTNRDCRHLSNSKRSHSWVLFPPSATPELTSASMHVAINTHSWLGVSHTGFSAPFCMWGSAPHTLKFCSKALQWCSCLLHLHRFHWLLPKGLQILLMLCVIIFVLSLALVERGKQRSTAALSSSPSQQLASGHVSCFPLACMGCLLTSVQALPLLLHF